jgi:hypothetical protein
MSDFIFKVGEAYGSGFNISSVVPSKLTYGYFSRPVFKTYDTNKNTMIGASVGGNSLFDSFKLNYVQKYYQSNYESIPYYNVSNIQFYKGSKLSFTISGELNPHDATWGSIHQNELDLLLMRLDFTAWSVETILGRVIN